MSTYLDASFLASLYCPDANNAAALHALESVAGELLISTFAELGFLNTLALRVFRKQDAAAQSQLSLKAFEEDVRNGVYILKPLPEHVFMRARQLSQHTTSTLGTRAGNLLPVAAALELGADAFYTFDRQQAKLAESVKLKINPQI